MALDNGPSTPRSAETTTSQASPETEAPQGPLEVPATAHNVLRTSIERQLDALVPDWRDQAPALEQKVQAGVCVDGCSALAGRRIVFIDDSSAAMALFAAELVAASGDNALFLVYSGQGIDTMAREIAALKPDLVLLDGDIGRVERGWMVLESLLRLSPQVACLGLSSELQFEHKFLESGAVGFVQKRYNEPLATIQAVSEIGAPFLVNRAA